MKTPQQVTESVNIHIEHYFPKGYDPDKEPWKSIKAFHKSSIEEATENSLRDILDWEVGYKCGKAEAASRAAPRKKDAAPQAGEEWHPSEQWPKWMRFKSEGGLRHEG